MHSQTLLYNASVSPTQFLAAVLAALLGGLLVNYLADVLPRTRRLSRPEWWPLNAANISAYFSHSRSRVVHLVALGLVFWLLTDPLPTWPIWQSVLVLLYFGVVVVIDLEHRAILHPVSIAGAAVMGAIGLLRHGLFSTLVGGLAGFTILLALYGFGELFGRWLARRRGDDWDDVALGFGDVNLAGVIGLLLGWPAIAGALFLTVLIGGAFSLFFVILNLLRGKYEAFAAIPYGPFLVLGVLLLILLRA